MNPPQYPPVPFDPATADERTRRALHAFNTVIRRESLPDDPPRSFEAMNRSLDAIVHLEDVDVRFWLVWQGDRVVGEAVAVTLNREDNQHLMQVELNVHPDSRRQGIARELLRVVHDAAIKSNRTLLIADTVDRIPAGAALAQRLGADHGLEAGVNQLRLDDLDRELLRRWSSPPAETRADFALELVRDRIPDELIEEFVDIKDVMNTAPRDNLDVEDEIVTPETLRGFERYRAARGIESRLLLARHRASGELAGYTETFFDPEEPDRLQQGDTAVLERYRGRGLGKWLKARMLEIVFEELPSVRLVRTGNAASNAPMLAINHALGFERYRTVTVWQLPREKLARYLEGVRSAS